MEYFLVKMKAQNRFFTENVQVAAYVAFSYKIVSAAPY